MNDFERQLQNQEFRGLPANWRREILVAAAEATPEACASSWREWLWPSPLAWAAVAVCWIVIVSVHLGTPRSSSRNESGVTRSSAPEEWRASSSTPSYAVHWQRQFVEELTRTN